MKKLIILPVINEANTIPEIVNGIIKCIPDMHILFIDDNSTDGSKEILTELENKNENIKVIHRPKKLGLASAYITGFRYAIEHDYQTVSQMDSDLSHDPTVLNTFYNAIGEYDFVIGSRYIKGGNVTNWSALRKFLSKSANLYARMILRTGITDYTGGYNTWRIDVLKSLDLNRIKTQGYSFLIELKYKAVSKGFSFAEIPIIFSERKAGKSKMDFKIILEAVWRVWSFLFK